MILVPHHPKAELFSQINFILTHIEALGHADFYVDWTHETPYSGDKGDNLFEELFLQTGGDDGTGPIVRNWPHYRYTWKNANTLYLTNSCWRNDLHECW